MKKAISGLIISTGLLTAAVHAIAAPLMMSEQNRPQKVQLRQEAINFFSERYLQQKIMKKSAIPS